MKIRGIKKVTFLIFILSYGFFASAQKVWYRDVDGDYYGNKYHTSSQWQPGYVANGLDCNDFDRNDSSWQPVTDTLVLNASSAPSQILVDDSGCIVTESQYSIDDGKWHALNINFSLMVKGGDGCIYASRVSVNSSGIYSCYVSRFSRKAAGWVPVINGLMPRTGITYAFPSWPVVFKDGRIFIVQYDNSSTSHTVQMYSYVSGSFQQIPDAPMAWNYSPAVVYGDSLYYLNSQNGFLSVFNGSVSAVIQGVYGKLPCGLFTSSDGIYLALKGLDLSTNIDTVCITKIFNSSIIELTSGFTIIESYKNYQCLFYKLPDGRFATFTDSVRVWDGKWQTCLNHITSIGMDTDGLPVAVNLTSSGNIPTTCLLKLMPKSMGDPNPKLTYSVSGKTVTVKATGLNDARTWYWDNGGPANIFDSNIISLSYIRDTTRFYQVQAVGECILHSNLTYTDWIIVPGCKRTVHYDRKTDPVCIGETATLSDGSTVLHYGMVDTFYRTSVDLDGCDSTTAYIVESKRVDKITSLLQSPLGGGNYLLEAKFKGSYYVKWDFGDGAVQTIFSASATHHYSKGSYIVRATIFGCSGDSSYATVAINEDGLSVTPKPSRNRLSQMSPNPATSMVWIADDSYWVAIFSLDGKFCMESKGGKIDISKIPIGTYIIRAASKNETFSDVLIKN